MPTKFELPKRLRVDDKFKLSDTSWSFIFPQYWAIFRIKSSRINVATFKVIEKNDHDSYLIECMDIVPETGRLIIPTGLKTTVNLKTIHLAMALNHVNTR